MSDTFPVKQGMKEGHALLPLLSKLPLECAINWGSKENLGIETKWGHISFQSTLSILIYWMKI